MAADETRKVHAFASWIDEHVRVDGDRERSARDTRRLKLSTVLARCGWKRRSAGRMELLTSLLASRGISTNPNLTDDEIEVDDWVRFSRVPPPVPIQKPPTEADLIEYIRVNYRLIPPLDQYGGQIEKEYRLPSGSRVDLVLKDPKRRRWLLIEVENKGDANHESPLQLCDYMLEVTEKHLVPDGFEVEGMIISAAARPHHVDLLMSGPACGRVHWLTFSMQLQLKPAAGSGHEL